MDIDRLNDRIDALKELRMKIAEVEEEARALGVEAEMGAVMQELGVREGMAARYYAADREALSRAFERMAM